MRPIYLYIGVAVLAILVAIIGVVAFGPEGTPTGTTRATLDPGAPCDQLEGEARQRCLTGAGGATTAPDARDREASSYSGRNTRGSGIEGVDSGGVTTEPPR